MKTSNKMKKDENGNELWSFFSLAEAVFSTQSAFHDRIIDEILILFKFFYRLLKNVFHGNRFCWSNKKKTTQWQPIFSNFPSISCLILSHLLGRKKNSSAGLQSEWNINFEGTSQKETKGNAWNLLMIFGISISSTFIDFYRRLMLWMKAAEWKEKSSKLEWNCYKFYAIFIAPYIVK